ncbi:hypothetical protein CMO93_03150 [Candidatus Woesearchaeota archaeon]|nr:hypothetical protein [Candidatus Woesearchaeota archaeon]|tara:strand:+ start:2559 stop:3104 length:546 start_codon:yes stop_codon:yes gene_type:complete
MNNTELDIILILLKYKDVHVRGISKLLEQPHPTISRTLNKLKKSNIIDSKNIGRNKVYFLKKVIETKNYAYIAEHHKFLKLMDKYPEVGIISEKILSKTKENLIIIFGSYAKFIAKPTSDMDIYVETKNKKIKKLIEDINSKINVKIGKFDLSNLLIKEIIKDHIIIRGVECFYEKNNIFD